jgi:hypothetical protein
MTFAHDAAFLPSLDLPYEAVEQASQPIQPPSQAPRRGPDGRFQGSDKQAYQHSPVVARLAADLGYSDEEINETAPELLEERVYHVNRRTMQLLAAQRQVTGPGIRQQAEPSQVVQPQPDPSEEIERLVNSEEFDFDPRLVRVLKHSLAENKALKQQISSQKQSAALNSLDEQIDQAFAGLKMPQLFGNGNRHTLALDSEEMARRFAVYGEAQKIKGGTLESRLRQAASRLWPGETRRESAEPEQEAATYVPENLQRRRELWDHDGPTARPTNRKPAPLSPDTRAALAAQEYMKNHTMSELISDTDFEP